MAYQSVYTGAQIDAAVAGVQSMSNYSATLLAAEDAETARTALELSNEEIHGYALGASVAPEFVLVTANDLHAALDAVTVSVANTATLESGVVSIDLVNSRNSLWLVSLTEDVTEISISNFPTGTSHTRVVVSQDDPESPFALPIAAWAAIGTTVTRFISSYYIYQDVTPTYIDLYTVDGGATVDIRILETPGTLLATISGSTALAYAEHAGYRLTSTAPLTLTVDATAGFFPGERVTIDADGGAVTLAASGTTIQSLSGSLVIPQYGTGVLRCLDTDVYALDISLPASPQLTTIELGHASDTTLARASAGVVSVEGKPLGRVIASGTASLGTSAIASGASASVVTVSATGVATTDVIDWGFNGTPAAVTGYVPSANGMLTIIAYPTANNVNFLVANNTAASVTPGAITLNWRVMR
jgi:hypothetical protein